MGRATAGTSDRAHGPLLEISDRARTDGGNGRDERRRLRPGRVRSSALREVRRSLFELGDLARAGEAFPVDRGDDTYPHPEEGEDADPCKEGERDAEAAVCMPIRLQQVAQVEGGNE